MACESSADIPSVSPTRVPYDSQTLLTTRLPMLTLPGNVTSLSGALPCAMRLPPNAGHWQLMPLVARRFVQDAPE